MRGARILIVDDDPDIVRILAASLKTAGYEIIAAPDGVTATQTAVREQPDLILLDIGLPGGDGHTIAARLKDNLKTMSIPLVYLTARDTRRDMHRADRLGAAAYITKPFVPAEVCEIVARVLAGESRPDARSA